MPGMRGVAVVWLASALVSSLPACCVACLLLVFGPNGFRTGVNRILNRDPNALFSL
jgi:hypothetical protein